MIKLYIQVENGIPINHPSYEEHVLAMYGGVIPEDWEPFDRLPRPEKIDKHQYISPMAIRYEKNSNGVWTDVYEIRPMTDEERYAYDLQEVELAKIRDARGTAERKRNYRISVIEQMISETNDVNQFAALKTVLDAHKYHVFKTYDPIDPPFMKYPKQDENGNWYIPE